LKLYQVIEKDNIVSELINNGVSVFNGIIVMPIVLKLLIIIKKLKTMLKNPTVGDILKYEFLQEIGMSQNALAYAINVHPNRINAIIKGTRSITADTDLRLCRFFGLSEGYFLRLQNDFDLMEAKRKLGATLNQIEPLTIATD
jgi:antitoxin HigA-1